MNYIRYYARPGFILDNKYDLSQGVSKQKLPSKGQLVNIG
jgi:hypothetical protein